MNPLITEFLDHAKVVRTEQQQAAALALPALDRLVKVCQGNSGQGYKVRALLWSLYNGKPADLSDVLCLDWQIRKDVCQCILAFGFENKGEGDFFYDEIRDAFNVAGLLTWFQEQSEVPTGRAAA